MQARSSELSLMRQRSARMRRPCRDGSAVLPFLPEAVRSIPISCGADRLLGPALPAAAAQPEPQAKARQRCRISPNLPRQRTQVACQPSRLLATASRRQAGVRPTEPHSTASARSAAASRRSCKQPLRSGSLWISLDLKSSVAGVWWLGPTAGDLANNNLAAAQIVILQGAVRKPPLRVASCKQHPSGVPASLG